MLSDEEKKFKASHFENIDELIKTCEMWIQDDDWEAYCRFFDMGAMEELINLIEKQSKEIEELKETLKCTQNSWFEDTQKIEEMKKQIDLDNECEIALNNKIMDLEKEIEELKETLKCTQNSWFEDTQKIEEMKKQIDLDNECEIALNNKIMDLEKEIEELKENNKTLKNLQNDTNRLYIEMIERKNYFERELQKVVDKIKAKIEEIDKQEKEVLKGTKGQDRYAIKQEYMHKRSGVQSLLEKE